MDYEAVEVHADDRGLVFEPVGADDLAVSRNVHVVISRPGQVRGNHYHAHASEIITVTGPAHVRTRESGRVEDVSVPEGRVYRFRFAPGVSHGIRNMGTEDSVLVTCSSRPHDPQNPDTIRDTLL